MFDFSRFIAQVSIPFIIILLGYSLINRDKKR